MFAITSDLIFSFLSTTTLGYGVTPVCRRWCRVASRKALADQAPQLEALRLEDDILATGFWRQLARLNHLVHLDVNVYSEVINAYVETLGQLLCLRSISLARVRMWFDEASANLRAVWQLIDTGYWRRCRC
jgi:hypothetical protein